MMNGCTVRTATLIWKLVPNEQADASIEARFRRHSSPNFTTLSHKLKQ
jgi:hypothetical protein